MRCTFEVVFETDDDMGYENPNDILDVVEEAIRNADDTALTFKFRLLDTDRNEPTKRLLCNQTGLPVGYPCGGTLPCCSQES